MDPKGGPYYRLYGHTEYMAWYATQSEYPKFQLSEEATKVKRLTW